VYVATTIILIANLFYLWIYSGVVRSKTKTTLNPEDAKAYGSELKHEDPPEVARALRVHHNAEVTTYPFIFLEFLYVLVGGSWILALTLSVLFIISRIAHAFFYLKAMQPWRSIAFSVSFFVIVVTAVSVICYLF
jgi:uncharacterized membrane protein YecN with MAPEG domain